MNQTIVFSVLLLLILIIVIAICFTVFNVESDKIDKSNKIDKSKVVIDYNKVQIVDWRHPNNKIIGQFSITTSKQNDKEKIKKHKVK